MKRVVVFDQEVSAKETSRGKRVWFRSSMLGKICGMKVGDALHVFYERNRIRLVKTNKPTPENAGMLSITSSRGEASFDLHNKSVLKTFLNVGRVFIELSLNEVIISIRRSDEQLQQRIELFTKRRKRKEPIVIGDICSGIGGLSYSLSSGLLRNGTGARLAFAIDYHKETMEAASNNNITYDEDTSFFNCSLEQTPIDRLSQVDLLTVGLSCKGASLQARSGKKISAPELHPEAGWLPMALIPILTSPIVNPLMVCFENVQAWLDTVSVHMLKELMSRLGYTTSEFIIDSNEHGGFESRKRACLLFLTNGLEVDLTLNDAKPNSKLISTLLTDYSELPPVPRDINCSVSERNGWYPKQTLIERELKAINEGRGHRMKIIGDKDLSISTLCASYGKGVRLDESCVESPCGLWLRLLTPEEHCRMKSLPEAFVKDIPKTLAHQFMGNTVEKKGWEWLGEKMSIALKDFHYKIIVTQPLNNLGLLFN